MTCIVGIENKDGTVTIGGDSAGTTDVQTTMRADEKVFRLSYNQEYLVGFCGSFRFGQLLRYSLTPPKYNGYSTVHHYLVTDFVDELRNTLERGGFLTTENRQELAGGFFLLGFRGGLYIVENDFQVAIPGAGYAAIGDARLPALGALYATRHWANTTNRVTTALDAAQEFGTTVRAPYVIATL